MTRLEVLDLPGDRLPGDLLLVPLFDDQRPLDGPAAVVDWRLDGAISRMLKDGRCSGRRGEQLAIQANAKFTVPWIVLIGGGRWRSLERHGYTALIIQLLRTATRAGVREAALCLPPHELVDAGELLELVEDALPERGPLQSCRLSRLPRFS
jgi:hypothetical protein